LRHPCRPWLTSTIISQLDSLQGTHQRPRTRAWSKQEDERRRGAIEQPINAARRISSRQRGLPPAELNVELPEPQQDHPQAFRRIIPRTQQYQGPLVNQVLAGKQVGKPFARKPAKQQAKRTQVTGKSRKDKGKGNTRRTRGTERIEVSSPLRSRRILDAQFDLPLTQIGPQFGELAKSSRARLSRRLTSGTGLVHDPWPRL
jgi:hypothetical protein